MINIRRVQNGLQIIPNAVGNTAPSIQGEMAVWDRGSGGDGNIYYNNGLTTYPITAAITALTGDVTTTAGPGSVVATVQFVGGVSAAAIAASVGHTQAATSADTPNTLVLRDSSGNFAAGTITANLIGNVTGNASTATLAGNVTGIVLPGNGGTGVANSNSATLTLTAAYPLSLTLTASTSVTLPISGILATLSNTETFSNKTFSNQQTWQEITTPVSLPASGYIDIYAKSDNNIYTLNSAGLETSLTSGAAPSGAIVMFGGTSIPTGWLLCNGAAVSKLTYANLYSAIGTNYGVGNAATHSINQLTAVADVSQAAFATIGSNTIIATELGYIGNSIALVFDGTSDVAVITGNWNTANPSNPVTYTGSGSNVYSAQTLNLSGGSSTLDGTYFEIYDDTGLVIPWIKIASTTVQPTVAGATRYIEISTIVSDASANTVASDISAVLAADGQFTPTTVAGPIVTITNTSTISHTAGNAGDSPFTVVQTNTGGFSTFNLPDFRGLFPRGVDSGAGNDPDTSSRTATNGGNSGDNVGSLQADAYQVHEHYRSASDSYEVVLDQGGGPFGYASGSTDAAVVQNVGGAPYNGNMSTETRPKNLYVNFIIKF